jgi:hypothetical protein
MESLPQIGGDERPALAGEHTLKLFEAVNQHNQHSERFVLNHRLMNKGPPCTRRDEPWSAVDGAGEIASALHAQG